MGSTWITRASSGFEMQVSVAMAGKVGVCSHPGSWKKLCAMCLKARRLQQQ